jgi:hypothetical protein
LVQDFDADFLVERPEGQRIWVVRAAGGAFVRHFRQHGLMSIGHLNALNLRDGPITGETLLGLERLLEKVEPERAKGSITSHANQARTFCTVIAKDDLIVTLGSENLSVGRVIGEAYIDHKPLAIRSVDGQEHELHHHLRRHVVWGPRVSRQFVPAALELTMFAHQTVFNVDGYWDSIYHLLYPCFHYKDRLYLSANIKQREALDNFSVSQLFSLLSAIEQAARDFNELGDTGDVDWTRAHPNLNLTTKAEFMSPGSVWATVLMDSSTMLWCVVLYVMVFGGDLKFFKADGVIDKQTRQKAWNIVLKLVEKHHFNKVKNRLQVDVPRAETKAIDPPKKRSRTSKGTVKLDTSEPG